MRHFKKVLLAAFILASLCGTFLPVFSTAVFADTTPTNLIANPSMEVANTTNSTSPQSWLTDEWGTNTATFSYDSTGHTGSHDVSVSISKYTSGDAKWYFTPVTVTGSTKYSFSDYYKSSITSDVVAQLDDGSGNYTYVDMGSASAGTDWRQYTASLTTLSSTKSLTIFHLIAGVGTLSIDDVSLAAAAATSPVTNGSNLIANNSLETVDANNSATPQSWFTDEWGTNTATFSYDTSGHTGNRSVSVSISSYSSGDAKWYGAPVAVAASSSYTYSDYYKSSIASDVVAQYDDGSGNYTYTDLGAAAASSNWAAYSTTFTVPAGVKNVAIFHLIAGVGTLSIDDVSLAALTTTPTDPTTPTTPTTPAGTNLITNPSAEVTDATNTSLPQGWLKGGWGTNTATYSYDTSGHTGSRSLSLNISSYTSGDAKWYFTPVAVSGATQYTYSDYYKSSTVSDVVAQLDDGSGNYTYIDLGSTSASTDWKQYSASFTTEAATKSLTIFHLIASTGSLSIDDASLVGGSTDGTTPPAAPTTPVTPATDNLVPNPSLESPSTGNANLPLDWYQGQWGNNTTTFTYPNTGHTGSRSVGITMSNFVDGGANWTYDAQAVTPGKVYSFSNYYQSNTLTQVLAAVTLSDGSTQYVWLGNPYTSDGVWTRFFATFTMPANAVSAVVYQTISSNGYFTADDYSFGLYTPQGFSSPLVSVTFDDGVASQYTNGLPILQQYGINGTFYIITGDVGVCDPSVSSICYLTRNQVSALAEAGEEIGSHTVTHPDLTTLSAADVNTELSQSQATLESWLELPVTDLAAPYGDVNLSVLTASQQYYVSQRGVEAGYNSIDNYDQQDLLVQNVDTDTTTAQVESYIDYAKATNTWLILVYHDISTDTTLDPGYDTTPTAFETQMAYLSASGVSVQTITEALNTTGVQAGN